MNRIHVIFLISGLLLTSACQKHYEGKVSEKCDGTMRGVSLDSFTAETRCGGASEEGALLASDYPLPMGNGDTLYISVYLTDTEDETSTDETRSTPMKSKADLAYYYGQFYTDVYQAGEDTIYVSKDDEGHKDKMEKSLVEYLGSWNFNTTYFWPLLKSQQLYFCSYAPLDEVDGLVPTLSNKTWDKTNHKLSFDFKQRPTVFRDQDATLQNDLLLAVDGQAQETYTGKVHVNFRHAMVGVKFIKGVINGTIAYVGLENLYDEGTVNVTPDTLYWSGQKSVRNYSQEYNFDTKKHPADGTPIDSTETEDLTFMMIPQKLCDTARISIWMGDCLHPEKLDFNDLSSALQDWSSYAGKTITFRLSSTRVNNVKITLNDEVDVLTKKNIVIKNEGLSPLFIRAVLVGNWLNQDYEILASWSEDADNIYGYFDDQSTPAASKFPKVLPTNWFKGSDGFYYYKKYIKSDKVLSTNLFNTFTITGKPIDSKGTWKAPEVQDVDMEIAKFEMAILLQAVKADAGKASAIAAWGSDVASQLLLEADVE